MDRLESLRIFRTIVDHGSVTGAASSLGTSKAMVSKSLSALEQRLGARLLERTTRSLAMTELGQLVYDQAEGVLEGFANLEGMVRESQGFAHGHLKVSVPLSFPFEPLAKLTLALSQAEPNLTVEIVRSDAFVNLITEGFDVALRMANLADSQMIAKRLRTLRGGLFASPGYLAEHGTPAEPQELGQHRCILDDNVRPRNHFNLSVDGKILSVPISGPIKVTGVAASAELARIGGGIMAAPNIAVQHLIDSGELVQVLQDFTTSSFGLYVMYPGKQFLPLKVRRFVDLATEHLAAQKQL